MSGAAPEGREPGTGRQAPDAGGSPSGAPTYQGSRFPWWLAIIWLAFLAWGAIYVTIYYLPDLKAWLR